LSLLCHYVEIAPLAPSYKMNRPKEEGPMPNYMMLIYTPVEGAPSPDDPGLDLKRWRAYRRNLHDSGMLLGEGRLQPNDVATTVRVRNDETLITDGPFADTKEYLVGYFLLDCPDLDTVLDLAARIPHIHYGTVEVRPMMELTPASEEVAEPAQAQT
jgi:hypothetical protein